MDITNLKLLIKTILMEELSSNDSNSMSKDQNIPDDQLYNHDNDPAIRTLKKRSEKDALQLAAARESKFKQDLRNLRSQISKTIDPNQKKILRDKIEMLMKQLKTTSANKQASTSKIPQL